MFFDIWCKLTQEIYDFIEKILINHFLMRDEKPHASEMN